MNSKRTYTLVVWLLISLVLVSCTRSRKKLNQRISLWRNDKIPYGTWYAYNQLPYIFPGASVSINKYSPSDYRFSRTGFVDLEKSSPHSLYLIISPVFFPEPREVQALLDYAGNGNQVFISAMGLGDTLLSSLKLKTTYVLDGSDSLTLSAYRPGNWDSLSFTYPGRNFLVEFTELDTGYTSVLGRAADGRPNFIRIGYKGGGAIYLHLAPIALTNFFLLHKDNKAYYDMVFSWLPQDVNEIKWDDYFRTSRGRFSALRFILSNRALRWAFWLTIALFGLIYLFDSKRRQRIVPLIPPLRNSSLDFVTTIGRLYYQRRDNENLAQKIAGQFLEQVRSKYKIDTTTLDEEFINRLSVKSGVKREEVESLITDILLTQNYSVISDREVLDFHKKIEAFYKQT